MGVRITVQSLWPKADASAFVYEFAQSRIVIGRSRSADVQLPHAAVSGTHASIRTQGAGYALIDEGSTNGTRVNDVLLVPRDLVDLGGYRLSVDVGVPVAQTMSARMTAEYARKILSEQVEWESERELEAALSSVQQAPDERVDLLPIAKEAASEPPPDESRPSRPTASRPTSARPAQDPAKLGRGAIAVYALAAFVVATSLLAMALLMRP